MQSIPTSLSPTLPKASYLEQDTPHHASPNLPRYGFCLSQLSTITLMAYALGLSLLLGLFMGVAL